MHFKHPELLYALFLLLIPLLVHLFRLRRFRKEKFTNVKFLKKAVQQSRKSSEIKRWLVLFLRLFAMACIVFAFAQPLFPASEISMKENQTVIYLDNSYSMQAKGSEGVLLRRSVQDLLEQLPREEVFSLFTNDFEYRNVSLQDLQKELQQLPYSSSAMDAKAIALKAGNLFAERGNIHRNFIAISDFQKHSDSDNFVPIPGAANFLVQLQPENLQNIFLDTAFISSKSLDQTELNIRIRSNGQNKVVVPISLYNGDTLLAKKTLTLEDTFATSSFSLPAEPIEEGRVEIEATDLTFDNILFFSINEVQPIEVVSIGSGETEFLERIYSEPNFGFHDFPIQQIDFNKFSSADLIILNEPREFPPSLGSSLARRLEEGAVIIVIPAPDVPSANYKSLFTELGLPPFGEQVQQEKKITDISYDHPLYRFVFEEEVGNFQYPMVKSYSRINGALLPLLKLENGDSFLVQQGNVFLFSAGLNGENSNFQNSPLIVPTFYNIGNNALAPTPLYYILGEPQEIDVAVQLEQDEILKLSSEAEVFIPLQESFSNKVSLQVEESITQPGHYVVQRDSFSLKSLSFNINRQESLLHYWEPKSGEKVEVGPSVPAVFDSLESKSEISELWKWFVIFALIFLLTEMLILKLFK